MNILPRSLTERLARRIGQDPVIVLTGARQTGKTTLAEVQLPGQSRLEATYLTFDDPDERLRFQGAAVSILESIETPLAVLDEAQKIPALFDPLKVVVDRQARKKGARTSFILTGSSQLLLMRRIRESLAGRAALFTLYPFSLREVMGLKRTPLLDDAWKHQRITPSDEKKMATASPAVVRKAVELRNLHRRFGGYPPVWQRSGEAEKLAWLRDYRRTYLERDISDVGQVADIDAFALAQKLLCARTGGILSLSEVARDLGLAVNTVKRYLGLLTMSYQCFLLPPFHGNVGQRFIKSPKIHFPDTGLIRAILGEMSVSEGALYESWVFAELLKWKENQAVEPDLFHLRTSGGLEIDFILAGGGRVLPIEAKASSRVGSADGRSLELFIKDHPGKANLGIVVYPGTELAQVRKNVWAVPDWYLFSGL